MTLYSSWSLKGKDLMWVDKLGFVLTTLDFAMKKDDLKKALFIRIKNI